MFSVDWIAGCSAGAFMVAMLISKNVNEKEFPLLGTELYFIAKKKQQTNKQTNNFIDH